MPAAVSSLLQFRGVPSRRTVMSFALLEVLQLALLAYSRSQWETFRESAKGSDHRAMILRDFVRSCCPTAETILNDPRPAADYYCFFAVMLAPVGALELPAAKAI